MDKILNYINGEFIESVDKGWINNVDPSIGKVYSLIPDSKIKMSNKPYRLPNWLLITGVTHQLITDQRF